jgi:hypothetical protein
MRKLTVAVLLMALLGGCASLRLELPERFKDQKQKQDPPLGGLRCPSSSFS